MSKTPNTKPLSPEIKALADKARAFDEEYVAIVAEQHTADHVQPHVLRKMLAYSARMQAFEAELATLDQEQIDEIVTILGFPRS
jgi:hypothetical protein